MSEEFTNVLGWSGEVLVGRGRVESFKYYVFCVSLEKSSDKIKMTKATTTQSLDEKLAKLFSLDSIPLQVEKGVVHSTHFNARFSSSDKEISPYLQSLGVGARKVTLLWGTRTPISYELVEDEMIMDKTVSGETECCRRLRYQRL